MNFVIVLMLHSRNVLTYVRNAIPKNYGDEYGLHCQWGTYGKPEYLFTDGGKDFRFEHLSSQAELNLKRSSV